jgi:hypothetical protein
MASGRSRRSTSPGGPSRASRRDVTTFRIEFAGSWAGPDSWPIVIPAKPGCSGWTTGSWSFAAALIISVIRTMSAPSSGVSRSPERLGRGDDVEHPAVGDVDRDGAEMRHLDTRFEVGGERRHVSERHAGHLAAGAVGPDADETCR